MSKCFCHFNGYEVKDAAARRELETLVPRVNNLTTLEGPVTTGDAELIDARVGADGVTYDNLGNAIRTQFTNVKSDFSKEKSSFVQCTTTAVYFEQNGMSVTITLVDNVYNENIFRYIVNGQEVQSTSLHSNNVQFTLTPWQMLVMDIGNHSIRVVNDLEEFDGVVLANNVNGIVSGFLASYKYGIESYGYDLNTYKLMWFEPKVSHPVNDYRCYVKFNRLVIARPFKSTLNFYYDDVDLWKVTDQCYGKNWLYVGENEGVHQSLCYNDMTEKLEYVQHGFEKPYHLILAKISVNENGNSSIIGAINEAVFFENEQSYYMPKYRLTNENIYSLVRNKEVQALTHGDENTFRFAYVSDTHSMGARNRYANLALLYSGKTVNHNNLDVLYHAGDLIAASPNFTLKDGIGALRLSIEDMNCGSKLVVARGNHDANGHSDSHEQKEEWTIKNHQIYQLLHKNLENNPNVQWGSKMDGYFYIDYPEKKIRLIVLNTSDFGEEYVQNGSGDNVTKHNTLIICGVRQNQISWLANTALNFTEKENPQNWHTVIMCHVGVDDSISDNSPVVENASIIRNIIRDFKNGENGTYSHTDTKCDGLFTTTIETNFSSQGVMNLVGIFSGHNHADEIHSDGFNSVTITAGFNHGAEGRVNDTINEMAYDLVSIDTTNKRVYLTRIGYGSDREFTY